MSEDYSRVTRFEVVNHTRAARMHVNHGLGRVVVSYDVSVELLLQDDGTTLKVILTDRDQQEEKGHDGDPGKPA